MTVPTGTITEVLDWVGDDPARAQEALDAEYAGANRSTLISQLEAIASTTQEDDTMSASANETLPAEGDADALAPGPEQPAEVIFDAEDADNLTVSPMFVRDGDVDQEPAELEELIDGAVQVVSVQVVGASNGCIIAINGIPYAFNAQMTATLKQIADKAVAGVTL